MSKIAERLTKCFGYDAETKRTLLTTRSGGDYDTLLGLLYEVAKEVDDDMAYEEVRDALDAIAEHGIECVEVDYYEYCEADIYAHDLLEWAGKNLRNTAWCDAEVSMGDHDNMAAAIATGQAMAKEYVWRTVIDFVQKLEEEEA